MWLGLLYVIPDDAKEDDGATVILRAWETGRPRPLTVAAAVADAPQIVRMLRESGRGASIAAPCCDACGASFELPPLD